jgi:hypothetical protein
MVTPFVITETAPDLTIHTSRWSRYCRLEPSSTTRQAPSKDGSAEDMAT